MAQFRNVLSASEKVRMTIRFLEGVSIPSLEIRFSTTRKVVHDKIREVLVRATAGTRVKLPDPLVLQSVTRATNGEKKYVTARDMAAELLPLVKSLQTKEP